MCSDIYPCLIVYMAVHLEPTSRWDICVNCVADTPQTYLNLTVSAMICSISYFGELQWRIHIIPTWNWFWLIHLQSPALQRREKQHHCYHDHGKASFSAPKELQSPALERTADSVRCYINIEAVLSWVVFDDQGFDESLDLRTLLQANVKNRTKTPAISVSLDFELCSGNGLFRQFLDHVHTFNPVLEEAKVNEYMRHARFNGLGWDAQSCLLVNIRYFRALTVRSH